MVVHSINHVQLPFPSGAEGQIRNFYNSLLGLPEVRLQAHFRQAQQAVVEIANLPLGPRRKGQLHVVDGVDDHARLLLSFARPWARTGCPRFRQRGPGGCRLRAFPAF